MTKISIKQQKNNVKIPVKNLLQERRKQELNERKQKIIENAKKIIFDGGNPTIRKLTNSIKYSVPVFFVHFSSKQELIDEIEEEIKQKYPDYDSLFLAFKKILSK